MLKRVARHLNTAEVPRVSLVVREDGGRELVLEGCWTLALLGAHLAALNALLAAHTQQPGVVWNCLGIARMDSAGAMTIWRAWGRHLPEHVQASPEHLHIFERIAQVEQTPPVSVAPVSPLVAIMQVGKLLLVFGGHAREFVSMIGQLVLDFLHLLRSPAEIPRREISANLYKSGVKAMPVTALVGFLIGIVMSYLSALQLKQFGGEVFIVNILGMSIIRELGPVLVAVLVAGRSGSAMTAQLGVMRVTEEIDALATMGVSHSLRLIFPKVLALAVVMPLLVLWLSSVALLGGMVAAQMQLDGVRERLRQARLRQAELAAHALDAAAEAPEGGRPSPLDELITMMRSRGLMQLGVDVDELFFDESFTPRQGHVYQFAVDQPIGRYSAMRSVDFMRKAMGRR